MKTEKNFKILSDVFTAYLKSVQVSKYSFWMFNCKQRRRHNYMMEFGILAMHVKTRHVFTTELREVYISAHALALYKAWKESGFTYDRQELKNIVLTEQLIS